MEKQLELPGLDAEQVTPWIDGEPQMVGWYDTRFKNAEGVPGPIVSRRLWRGPHAGWSKPAQPNRDESKTLWLARTDDECPVDRSLLQFRGMPVPSTGNYMVMLYQDHVVTASSQRVRTRVDTILKPLRATPVQVPPKRRRVFAIVPF